MTRRILLPQIDQIALIAQMVVGGKKRKPQIDQITQMLVGEKRENRRDEESEEFLKKDSALSATFAVKMCVFWG